MRAVCLIDGEHHLPVNRAGIAHVRGTRGYEVLAAVFIGGHEKISTPDDLKSLSLPVILDSDPMRGIARAIEEFAPDVVVDLSDDPVAGYRERFRFANLILSRGVAYEGADFRFAPPVYHDVCRKPSLSVIGTAKRVGKTALGAHAGRVLAASGEFDPCIVTMGRGGPPEPEVIRGKETELTPQKLLEFSRQGKHAASDHFEDALMSRLTTIGCRRCGGGFAGVVYYSVVPEGAQAANDLPEDFVIFEGSGPSIPPVRTDAWIIAVDAYHPLEVIEGFMGPYRIAKSDVAVLTMCEEPMADEAQIVAMEKALRSIKPDLKIVRTIFRPKPLREVSGKNVFLATTAPQKARKNIVDHLEKEYGCRVTAVSHSLSNRPQLRDHIQSALRTGQVDTLITEVKAAAIDVVTAMGLEAGLEVVLADNIPISVGGDDTFDNLILGTARLARERFTARNVGAKRASP